MTTVDGANALGWAVRAAREEAGLTQRELAQRAGVGRQWLVGLELGDKRAAPLDMILRILGVLDLQITLTAPQAPIATPAEIDLDKILDRYQRGHDA